MTDILISDNAKDNKVAAAIGEPVWRERSISSLFYNKDNIRAGQCRQERLRQELTNWRVVLPLLSRNWLDSHCCYSEAVTAAFCGKDALGIERRERGSILAQHIAAVPDSGPPAQRPAVGGLRFWLGWLWSYCRNRIHRVLYGEKLKTGEFIVFISYRHVEPDRHVAEWLHGAVETFPVPRALRPPGGSARLGRVFRDEEELSASSNLPKEIEQALNHSKWLIVVCSPRAAQSRWVNREIEYFRQLGRDQQILALLIEGEPASSFPASLHDVRGELRPQEIVQHDEPLAADMRARDTPGQRIRHFAKLRLLATILGCRFDDLRQREQERQQRRLLLLTGVMSLVLVVVGFMGWLANEQRKEAQLQRDITRTQLLAIQARRAEAGATSPDEIELAGALALASIAIAHQSNRSVEADAIETVTSVLMRLPLAVISQGSAVRPRALLSSGVTSLAVLADGRLASGSYDGNIKIWPKEGAGEPVVLTHGGEVLSLAVLPDGRLASGGIDNDGAIKLWSKDGTGEPEVFSHGSPVDSLAVLADGRLVSGGGLDGKIKLWPKGGRGDPVVLSHGSGVRALAVLADGRLASGGADSKIRLWPKDGAGAPVVLTHDGEVLSLAVLPDGRWASGGYGGIKIWPKEGAGALVVLSHGSQVLSLAVLADGRLASGGTDGTIKLWPKDGAGAPVVLMHGSPVLSLAVLADGRLASGGDDDKIKLWPKDGTGEPVVLSYGSPVRSLAVLADGRLASDGEDDKIKLWPKDGTGGPAVLSHPSRVQLMPPGPRPLAVLADGRLASGADDGTIKLWPKDDAGEPVVLSHGSLGLPSLSVLPDGRLASGGGDGTIKLWPKDDAGEPVVLSHGGVVLSLAVLADGRLASGADGGTIKLWPKDGAGVPVVLSNGSAVLSLTVLTDGRLASGGENGMIKLWPRGGTGEPVVLAHGRGFYYRVLSLTELPDGRLASGGGDGTIKLWPKHGTGDPVVLSHGSAVHSLAVLPDGRLASGGGDGTIKLWLVEEQKLIQALCLRAGRNLTKAEWARYIGTDTPSQPSCRDLPSNWRTPG
jgi:WD40 repeat protein